MFFTSAYSQWFFHTYSMIKKKQPIYIFFLWLRKSLLKESKGVVLSAALVWECSVQCVCADTWLTATPDTIHLSSGPMNISFPPWSSCRFLLNPNVLPSPVLIPQCMQSVFLFWSKFLDIHTLSPANWQVSYQVSFALGLRYNFLKSNNVYWLPQRKC